MRFTTTSRRGRLGSERGQALVETALVVPVLMLLILGAIYLGRDINFANDATQLAGEGARLAAVAKDPPETLNTYLLNRAQSQSNGFHDAITKVCIDFPDGGSRTAGSAVRVSITVDLGSIKLPLIDKQGITSTRGATMRLEKDAPANYACPA
jgi:Flp pilus assembly protein TadG